MKKVFYLVAVATFVFFSCKKEVVSPVESQNSLTLRASIEQLASPTKADINANNELVWAKGDQIGVYVNGWADNSNQSFTLEGDGGATTGSFARTSETWFETDQAQLAFFPWTSANATTVNVNTDNNVSGTTAYFKLPASYSGYTSGKMFTPLLATMSYNSTESKYDPIEFKHVGAAVKVTINNLPAGAHSIGMKVDGQQIHGDFHATPNNAIAVDEGKENVANNEIWLNFEPAATERAFTFLFPVPTLTTPKLIFKIYDENDILVWEKKLKAQTNSLARADVLEMPAIDITPYNQFNALSEYYVHGALDGSTYADYAMVTDGSKTKSIVKGLTFSAGGKFTVTDGTTYIPEGWGNDWVVNEAGTYDIIFDPTGATTADKIKVVKSNCPYPGNVTLYFGITPTDYTAIKFCSPSMGTDGWPGTELTEYEEIMGKKYYKYVTSVGKVWGKTLTDLHIYGVASSDWATAASTGNFTTNKNEYYFNVSTKYDVIIQLDKRPAPPAPVAITIDGTMSDWDACLTESTNATNNYLVFKATYDKDYIYLYTKRKTVPDQQYIYYDFDLDNDSTNGVSEGSREGLEAYMALALYDGNNIVENPEAVSGCVYPNTSVYEGVVCKGTVGTEITETELSIPRSNLGINKGDVIKIYSWGNKSADGVASHPITLYIEN